MSQSSLCLRPAVTVASSDGQRAGTTFVKTDLQTGFYLIKRESSRSDNIPVQLQFRLGRYEPKKVVQFLRTLMKITRQCD